MKNNNSTELTFSYDQKIRNQNQKKMNINKIKDEIIKIFKDEKMDNERE